MIKVAVTGGICSGKSTICKYIENRGYKVYYSDNIAKELVNTNEKLRTKLINEFGEKTFIENKYNTKYIANIVFNDDNRLKKLDNIFSSFMDEEFKKICEKNKEETVIFYESALIHKHGKEKDFDYIINAFVYGNIAHERLMKRNKLSFDEASTRLNSQLNPCEIILKSDITINTGFDNWEKELDDVINNILNNNL